MADTHLQLNHNGTTSIRKTYLWSSKLDIRKSILRQLFEQNNWRVASLENITGAHWKIKTQCLDKVLNINLYISSIRDESRQPDEFKMQLGNTYPSSTEDGWITLVLGIYVINEDGIPDEYILSGYDLEGYNFSTNPSIRGTRTSGLQKAKLYGMYSTDKSILFRPEFLYYYIEICRNKNKKSIPISDVGISNCILSVGSLLNSCLTALRTKPFMLLAGISGTGKSRIVRKLAQATVPEYLQKIEGYKGTDFANDRWNLHTPANFELIQVKPNWHNSMDVIGYLSNIPSPHYVFTPFVEFIAKAWQYPDVPFFLCLDEMNLAPVEEYFAEFLSAIESRSFEGDEYVTDPIIKPFNSFGNDTAKDMVNTLFPNFKAGDSDSPTSAIITHFRMKGLTLPKNLIVIGTVNMDETTFSFSRKVLDRAMSVEMNEVNYDSFLDDTTDNDIKAIVKGFEDEKYGDGITLNSLLVERHIEAKEIKGELGSGAQFVIDYLKRVNALLEGTPFKLGYRAANEALIYLRATQEFGQSDRVAALDNFTLMKILSRIEGDENKLKITDSDVDKERLNSSGVDVEQAKQYGDLNVLTALRNIIVQNLGEYCKANVEPKPKEEIQPEEGTEQEVPSENGTSPEVEKKQGERLKSIKKIDNMLCQLKRDHFVSYWN